MVSVVRQVSHLLEPLARERAREVSVSCPDDLPAVTASNDDLTRLLWNLAGNSLRHGGGEIEVAAEYDDGVVVLSVRDHGSGIPEENLPLVFENGVSRVKGGSGLGLGVCRRIAEAAGGMITIENAPGGGTLVRVLLPVIEKEAGGDTVRKGGN